MNKRTHWNIARLTLGKINELLPEYGMKGFKRFLFYLGTIEPDISIAQFVHPHYYDKSAGYIYSKINKMKEKEGDGLIAAYKMGTLVHYLCDFCCYAHINGGIGVIAGHVSYEHKINKYLNANYSRLSGKLSQSQMKQTKYTDVISYIDENIKLYKSSKPSYLVDIEKSIEISSALLLNSISNIKSFNFLNEQWGFING